MKRSSGNTVGTAVEASVRRNVGPLLLPQPDEPFAVAERSPAISLDHSDTCPPDATADRALFRWLLGQQTSHCAWRQLTEILSRMVREELCAEDLMEAAAWYHRCTALSIYAGSCGELVHRTAIRPSMTRAHPALADFVAREHTRALRLLRQVHVAHDSPLGHAIRINHLVHRRIVEILVPGSELPFGLPGLRPLRNVSRAEEHLFEDYFLVERVAVTEREFAAQAVRRTMTALFDIELYPIQRYEYEPVLAMLPDEITTVVHDMALAFNLLGRGSLS